MAVIRVERNENYTHMSNYHLRDKSLSLRAIGLLSKMLSLPPEWDYTVSGLAAICKEGRDAVRATLMELETAGYMVRQQTHTEAGTFGKIDYTVYERPMVPPLTENPTTVNPTTVAPTTAAPMTVQPLTENPSTVKPTTETPLTENPAQINKDLNKDLPKNPPIVPPRGRVRRPPKKEPDWNPELFDAFWKSYPRGESKQAAIAAWDKLMPDDDLIDKMATALKRQKKSAEWLRGVGIPYASTWLNQRRWEDDLSKLGAAQEAPSTGGDGEMEVQVWS